MIEELLAWYMYVVSSAWPEAAAKMTLRPLRSSKTRQSALRANEADEKWIIFHIAKLPSASSADRLSAG